MDIHTPEELEAAVGLQRLKRLTWCVRRARRRSLPWKMYGFLPVGLACFLPSLSGRDHLALTLGVSVVLVLVALGGVLLADRVDALVEVLEMRGLLDEAQQGRATDGDPAVRGARP